MYYYYGILMSDFNSKIGENLVKAHKRLFPKDTVRKFALRIGVSTATYQKMRLGDMSVSLAKYYQAARVLELTASFDKLFEVEGSLFDD